jgi:hypothetical protein
LRPSLTFDESLHDRPRYDLDDQKVSQSLALSHSLGRLLPFATGRNRQKQPVSPSRYLVSLLHGGIERIQSRAQGRWFLGVATSQGPDALLARASSLADQVQVLGYLAPA